MSEILTKIDAQKYGVDCCVKTENKRVKLLQMTDIQFIDAEQRRTPDRLRQDEIDAWGSDKKDALGGDQIRSLVAQSKPDLIFVTGDVVYGSFDDSGKSFEYFCRLMDSLKTPWAITFGNHDNESKRGVDWQCKMLEESEYCVFNRGEVTGNSNYTVGIVQGDSLVRVLYMIDSNGCCDSDDPKIIKEEAIFPDQLEWMRESKRKIDQINGKKVPAFLAYHIPTEEFGVAEREKGYPTTGTYVIGVNAEQKGEDFGARLGFVGYIKVEGLNALIKEMSVDGVFTGHFHRINTCIEYDGVKWVYGLKTSQYDDHVLGQNGGTQITLYPDDFEVRHIISLAQYARFPKEAPLLNAVCTE